MSARDRTLLAVLVGLGLVAAFWFLLMSPKRQEAGDLSNEVNRLESAVVAQESEIASAKQARGEFGTDYRRLVSLGKAVPEEADTSSLLAQLTGISRRAHVGLLNVGLSEDATGGAAASTAPPEDGEASGEPAADEGASSTEAAASTTPAPPTETDAASLPIGATVGPAGLPVMPYTLGLRARFTDLAGFMRRVNVLVRPRKGKVSSRGRLVTIDGFVLTPDYQKGFPAPPWLLGEVAATTYVTPAEQGLTAGATPEQPLSTPPPAGTPASSASPSSTETTAADPASATTATAGDD